LGVKYPKRTALVSGLGSKAGCFTAVLKFPEYVSEGACVGGPHFELPGIR